MRPGRTLTALLVVLAAVVIQTTLFSRVRVVGVAPDLVMLVVVLLTPSLADIPALLVGFTGGLLLDLLGSTAVGLRALVFTVVAYLAVRSRERAEYSSPFTALWAATLTAPGVVLLVLLGTVFNQLSFSGGEAVRRILLVPVLNLVLGLLLAPAFSRLTEPARRGL